MMSVLLLCWSFALPALAGDHQSAKGGKPAVAVEKFCGASSPADIIRSYGQVWGPISEQRGIDRKESQAIEDALIDLHTCRAISRQSDVFCQPLSKVPYRGGESEMLGGRCELER